MHRATHVLIMEDHDIVATSVAGIVKENLPDADVTLSRTFTKGVSLMKTGLIVDLVILDMNLPGGESYGMIPTLRSIQAGVRILIFTGNEEHRHALHFLSAGANGFLSKNSTTEEVAVAIRTVMKDKKYMTEEVQQRVAESFFKKIDAGKTFEDKILSPRELEVIELLLQGMQTKQIAIQLNLKVTTVSTHKARILDKMEVSNVIDLFKKLRPEE